MRLIGIVLALSAILLFSGMSDGGEQVAASGCAGAASCAGAARSCGGARTPVRNLLRHGVERRHSRRAHRQSTRAARANCAASHCGG